MARMELGTRYNSATDKTEIRLGGGEHKPLYIELDASELEKVIWDLATHRQHMKKRRSWTS
jgi:hypothetical protein